MPNQRKPGQMFIGCQADKDLVRDLDSGRGRKDRSQFIREAIAEKLAGLGIRVREETIYPPPRASQVSAENSGSGTQTNNFGKVSYSAKPKNKRKRK